MFVCPLYRKHNASTTKFVHYAKLTTKPEFYQSTNTMTNFNIITQS